MEPSAQQSLKRETRVIIEKSGIPVAAVVSAADLKRLTEMEQKRDERFNALVTSWHAFKDVPPDEIEEEVAKAVAQARQMIRTETAPRVASE